jgi:chemotaxis signal transduction protein
MTSYCVFNVGERRVAIELTYVREIIEHPLVVPTPIPLTPQFVHGLFNLRGQVLPHLDLSPFVGAKETPAVPGRDDRAVIVERGNLRFATTGQKIDTVEVDASTFTPLENAALLPALDVEANTDYGRFHVIHLDRLEACLGHSLKLTEAPAKADAIGASQNKSAADSGAAAANDAKPNSANPNQS